MSSSSESSSNNENEQPLPTVKKNKSYQMRYKSYSHALEAKPVRNDIHFGIYNKLL